MMELVSGETGQLREAVIFPRKKPVKIDAKICISNRMTDAIAIDHYTDKSTTASNETESRKGKY